MHLVDSHYINPARTLGKRLLVVQETASFSVCVALVVCLCCFISVMCVSSILNYVCRHATLYQMVNVCGAH